MRQKIAKSNKYLLNPLQRLWAGRVPIYGIIEHRGRRSGRSYRTPVLVVRSDAGFVIPIGYGENSDWVRNLVAAGGGAIVHRGQRYAVTDPVVLPAAAGIEGLSTLAARLVRRSRVNSVLRVRI